MDNFFKNLDRQIDAQLKDTEDKQQQELEVTVASRKNIEKVRPLLEKYKAELEKRGMWVDLTITDLMVTFELKHTHGGHHGFEIRHGTIKKRFWEKGKSHISDSDGPTFTKDVDIEAFEKFVQRIIGEFMLTAPQNGGFRKRH